MTDLLPHIQGIEPPVVTVVLLVLASVVLVVREPVSGRRSFARFRAAEAAEGEPARLRFYRSWTLQGCMTAILALILVAALPGVGLGDIGVRLPAVAGLDRFGLTGGSTSTSTIAGMITGVLLVTVGFAVVHRLRARRAGRKTSDGSSAPTTQAPLRGQMAAVLPMLPRTRAGRRGWAMLSLSAGVTEEITYRGFLLLTLAVALPSSTPRLTLVVLAAVLFGLAHWYQGWTGILSTGVFGAVMAGLYLSTGSLLVPMILHTLVDLRALLLPVPREPGGTASGTGTMGAADEERPVEPQADLAPSTSVPTSTST